MVVVVLMEHFNETKDAVCDGHGQPPSSQNAKGCFAHVGPSKPSTDGAEAEEGYRGRRHNGGQPVVVVGDEGPGQEGYPPSGCKGNCRSEGCLSGIGEVVQVDAQLISGMGFHCVHSGQLFCHLGIQQRQSFLFQKDFFDTNEF